MESMNVSEMSVFFGNALKNIAYEMAGVELIDTVPGDIAAERKFSVIVGIVGAHKGRVLLCMGDNFVQKITEEMNCGKLDSLTDTTLYIGEFSNILIGKAISQINNACKTFDLRLTPPAIFSGKRMRIITPELQSSILSFTSQFGPASMDVGFERCR